jgi:hypothetical protein
VTKRTRGENDNRIRCRAGKQAYRPDKKAAKHVISIAGQTDKVDTMAALPSGYFFYVREQRLDADRPCKPGLPC